MNIRDYSDITYQVSGMSVINDLKGTKQEGILITLRNKDDKVSLMFLDKHCCAHIAKTTKYGRKWWKRFCLPRMVERKWKKENLY